MIGNGFDLHHHLQTSFGDFKDFLSGRNATVQSIVEEYLCELSGNWANLEEALAYFNVDQMIGHAEDFLVSYAADEWSDAYNHDYQFEINEVVQTISRKLKSEFYEWIKQIYIPSADEVSDLLRLEPHAKFLNFNYTQTLQKIYSVDEKRVLHIHGTATDKEECIVLGHGWGQADRPRLNAVLEPEEIDNRVRQGNAIIERYFENTFKPTSDLIERNMEFFRTLGDITDVFVWGHSLSEVDLPYFSEIVAATELSEPCWHVSYHDLSSVSEHSEVMDSIGVKASKLHHHKLTHFVAKSIHRTA